MHRPLQHLALLLVLALPASAQTFVEGDYQLNRKKATAGFEVAELLAGSNITITWNDAAKTATLTSPLASTGGATITTLGTITTGTWQATPIADAYIASAATWNAKQAALVSGTNLKTVNGTSLLGSGNLAVGNITDGQTLTTGLTFPAGALRIRDDGAGTDTYFILITNAATGIREWAWTLPDDDVSITIASPSVTLSGTNTGDQTTITGNSGTTTAALGLKTATSTVGISTATAPSSGQVLTATSSTAAIWQTPAATGVTSVTGTGTVNGLTLTGTVTSTGNLTLGGTLTGLDAGSITTGTLPVANGGVHPLVTTGDNGSGYGRIGLWDADNEQWMYFNAGPSKIIFPDIQASLFSGNGSGLTSLNASNISTGTLGVARGGTGATTLTANSVLLGNGTSAFLEVAPGTTGNVLTSNGTTWTSQGAFSQLRLVDHFLGTLLLNTRAVGAGSAANTPAANTPTTVHLNRAPLALQTGTSTTGYAQVLERGSGSLGAWRPGASILDFCWSMVPGNLSDGTDTFTIRAGLETNNMGSVSDGLFFRYTHSTNSGNWQAVTRNAGVETVTNTSVAAGTAAYQKFRLLTNSAGTSVEFFINDVLVATHTTNIPASAGYSIGILKSAGTTNRILYVSPFSYIQTLNTPF